MRAPPPFQVNLSGLDKLMPDVDRLRVFESRLVHQLDRGKVVYSTRTRLLYYWEAPGGPLRRIVECALQSLGRAYRDLPVVMDNKGVFNKPRKVPLMEDEIAIVVTALRLARISVCVDDTDVVSYTGATT